jgi:hypothetical protein
MDPRSTAIIRMNGLTMFVSTAIVIMMGIMEITMPVKAEATMSPKRIVQTAIGAETNLSKVRAWLSHGKTTGDMAEHVKNTDTEINPGIRDVIDIPRPKANDMNINPGHSTPIRTTGPLE